MQNQKRHGWMAGIFCVLACTAVPASASADSRSLIKQGLAQMQQGDVAESLDQFNAAIRADPKDAEAWFFAGAAYNRLGDHSKAYLRFKTARALRSKNPDLDFEAGWSLVERGQWQRAADALNRYEKKHPGRALTSEFLGRAYLGLRQYKKARAKLEQAIQRDPELKPAVLLYLAQLDAAQGNSAGVTAHIQRLLREAPQSQVAATLREQIARLAPQRTIGAPTKPWHLNAFIGGGYNDNVIALGDNQPLPANISNQSSGFMESGLDAGYDFRLSDRDGLGLGYGLYSVTNPGVIGFNLLDQTARVEYRRNLDADLGLVIRLSDEYTQLSGRSFRNQLAQRASLGWRYQPRAALEFSYSLALDYSYFPVPAIFNRSGISHAISLTNHYLVSGTDLQTRFGTSFVRNDARGADFQFLSTSLFLGASHPIAAGFRADLSFAYQRDNYDNLNSLAGTGFAFARRDEIKRLSLLFAGPVYQTLGLYARYNFINESSNINFFSFSQNSFSVGFTASL